MTYDSRFSHRISVPLANLHAMPDAHAELTSQLLHGEHVSILSTDAGWHHVQNRQDGYQGYLEDVTLAPIAVRPTHWVATRATLIFTEPDIKSAVLSRIGFGAALVVKAIEPPWAILETGYVWAAHVLAQGEWLAGQPLDIARRYFLSAPYLWGGRSPDGLDCSALVQLTAQACGHDLPRDSGDQEQAMSQIINYSDRQAHDVVFWKGHVALLVNPHDVLHATAHTLDCRLEPLACVEQRAGPPTSIRRLALRNKLD